MDPTRLMTQPATITPRVVAADPDDYNDEILEDGEPIELDGSSGHGVFLSQRDRSESGDAENVTTETWALYLPHDIDVDATATITVDDVTYEFDGPPWRAYNPRLRRVTHLEATVRRVA